MPPLDPKFVAFLRATLSKMAGTDILNPEVIDLDFWNSWPRRFYNIRAYDMTKEELEKADILDLRRDDDEDDEDDEEFRYEYVYEEEEADVAEKKRPVRDEALVTFESARDRDDVRSFAKNLERRGRGLRLEVPDHLWPSFRVLQSVGYELKQKHPGLKRNVLFDNDKKDLKLDVCTGTDQPWRTIFPDGARQSLANMGKTVTAAKSTLSLGEIDDLLAAGDQDMEAGE